MPFFVTSWLHRLNGLQGAERQQQAGDAAKQVYSHSPLFNQPSDIDNEFVAHVVKLQGQYLQKPEEHRFLLMTHSGCCGFGNTLGALESSFILALLINCTWVTTSHYMTHFDHPGTTSWNVAGKIPPLWWQHEQNNSRAFSLGFQTTLAFNTHSFGSNAMNRRLAMEQLREEGNATFILREDRAVGVDKFISWLVSIDPFARNTLQALLKVVMTKSMHPSGMEVWAPWKRSDVGEILYLLRPPVVRFLCSRPASKLRSAIQELEDQLMMSSTEVSRDHRTCMPARSTPTNDVEHTKGVDRTLAVQIRTWKDASSYQSNQSYNHFWPCVAHAALKLKGISQRIDGRSRQPRVMVWLTSDDLPLLVPQFFSALSALRSSNIYLAAPACYPIPKGSRQAQDSRRGDVRAIAHWWALGASDAMVVSGSTYSYSAWLRAWRSGERNYDLDLSPNHLDSHTPHTFEKACHSWSSKTKWR